jgi:hypothetical protein
VGVGPGVRLKTDVNTDGKTDDKMDTGNSGAGEHAIDNCLLLYVRDWLGDIRGRRRRCAVGDVDVSTLKTGFVSSGEHMPVSQDSHNVCRSLTVLARRCGGGMDTGHRCHSPDGCPGGKEIAEGLPAFAARW